ncbi:hypothetical protein N7481_006528 [Penicillium waksmanii]|uniref:uncharacterized protein n=1 Tax=Penicillium waksmanii TaxID=69791 RepID=UPI0025482BDE|nr:uncharacterized protein N7481_006528 [Penicillium waksmanii]KAJ5984429.1 hypothetical protein N7481_006528 [Penicillium waksmanii]
MTQLESRLLVSNEGDGSLFSNTGPGSQNNNTGDGTQYNIVNQYFPQLQQREGLEELDFRILNSLAFEGMSSRHANIRRRHKDTCQWVLGLEKYRSWMSNTSGLLWIKGKPGTGKSTLMAFLHEQLNYLRPESHGIYLNFFFYARGKDLQHTQLGMFRSLLYHLFNRDESIRRIVREVYRQSVGLDGGPGYGGELSQSQLEEAFQKAVLASASVQQVVIFVDALDEAGATSALELATYFHELNANAEKEKLKLKICISCRHYPVPSTRPAVEITVENYNHGDITNYLQDHLSTSPEIRGQQLADKLIEQAGNMFQWACIILPFVQQKLAEGDSPEVVFDWLKEVPTPREDMNDTYQYILDHVIADWNWAQSFLLFQWVYLAERPLTLLEIRYALTVSNARATHARKGYTGLEYALKAEDFDLKIKALSGGLAEIVSVEDNRQIVQVIHQSVNDFLGEKGLPWLAARVRGRPLFAKDDTIILECQATLYRSCLDYLTIELLKGLEVREFEDDRAEQLWMKEEKEEVLQGRPFIHYAVTYLFVHAGKAQSLRTNNLEDDLRELERIFDLWFRIYYTIDTSKCPPKDSKLIHIAAAVNMNDIIEVLLTSRAESAAETDSHGSTLLHIAAQHGHMELARSLKLRDFSCMAKNNRDETPLILALRYDNLEIARWLLDEMKDSKAASEIEIASEIDIALQEASYKHQRDMVWLLKATGANVNFQGGKYGSALQAAASSGSADVVKTLLQAKANVNAKGGKFNTALQAAAFCAGPDLVRILLDAGAKINLCGGKYGTALQAAARAREIETVELLLQFGADVNQRGGKYETALQAAASTGSDITVECLVDAGANVNLKGGEYGSALQAAAVWGRIEVLKILLEAGADVNAGGKDKDPALQNAASMGKLDLVKLLLQFGADVNQRGGEYETALQAGAYKGNIAIVKCLIDAKANVRLKGGRYGTALQAAASRGNAEIVTMILNADETVNVNAHGGMYGSALHAAVARGSPDTVKILIEAGANVHAHVGFKTTPLEVACHSRRPDIMKILLEADSNVTANKERYSLALHLALENGLEEEAKILENAGVSRF